eukprot:6296701-Lingulodinium_polyedra.AAC.1
MLLRALGFEAGMFEGVDPGVAFADRAFASERANAGAPYQVWLAIKVGGLRAGHDSLRRPLRR